MRDGWLRGVVFCSGLSAPSLSAAAVPPVTRIEWDAPASCPDLSTVSARIASLRGNAAEDYSGLGSVRGVIRREGGRFVLTLELLDGGERESRLIAGDACEDLAEAAAVAIAIALDGGAVEPAAGDPATDALSVEGATEAVQPSAVPAARLMAHALLDTAALAQPALGVGCALQTPHPNPNIGFGCNAGAPADDLEHSGCELLSFPNLTCDEDSCEIDPDPLDELGPTDCNKAFLCDDAAPRCDCSKSGCSAAIDDKAEIVVRVVGDELVGTIGGAAFLNARHARTSLGTIRFQREP